MSKVYYMCIGNIIIKFFNLYNWYSNKSNLVEKYNNNKC